MPSLGGWEIVILVVVVLLLFGAKKLPDMARSVGQSARIFKGEMKGMKHDGKTEESAKQEPPAQLPPAQLPPAQGTTGSTGTAAAEPPRPAEQPAEQREHQQ
ncbi:Sec-independent protein translocase subunit TatA [Pseudonocardia kujensis]|uniref:Sec-independent protein translocase subunit TatA n=1 Tax=Pseudonocardia kujensis TaxID=1128675 RepID=UPI001E51952B|nr:Sec-independent protein translocase subunit TatA [Pseudonocardia kujensis]MCE0762208.1 Sec-independent protein translocase subunit TatA [Pseudonocardia kujensis]